MNILEYISEHALILIPALLILGKIIKEINAIPNKLIPLILLPFGIAGAIALGEFSAESVIQGILITGAAVYGNQIYKQMKKDE